MKTVILSGSQGFIGGYLCRELLSKGYRVIGVDNYSKYGFVKRDYDNHQNFTLYNYDLSSQRGCELLLDKCMGYLPEYIIAGAAMIGGIAYFHKYAYDLLATNERITANTFDIALKCAKVNRNFNRIVILSSSMVYEGADEYHEDIGAEFNLNNEERKWLNNKTWPTMEGSTLTFPPPFSTYGFQKLSTEYFARGAWGQYKLPYTIIRPFNAVGLGEGDTKGDEEVLSGNVRLMLSHVLPDLVNKCLRGQDPLHILGNGGQIRCYTHGKDIARGIRLAMESERGLNQSFNISTSRQTTVLELAKLVWSKINPAKEFRYISDKPFRYDVQKRIPDVSKARDILGFEANISLEDSVDEVIQHMRGKHEIYS